MHFDQAAHTSMTNLSIRARLEDGLYEAGVLAKMYFDLFVEDDKFDLRSKIQLKQKRNAHVLRDEHIQMPVSLNSDSTRICIVCRLRTNNKIGLIDICKYSKSSLQRKVRPGPSFEKP